MNQHHHKLSVLDVFWIYFVKNIDSTVQTTSIPTKSPTWRYFDWLLTKISICLRVATEAKSTKIQFWREILLSYQRDAQNKPKNVKNTFPTCLVLEELLADFVTAARTNAWFHEFAMFAPDLERPKCNSGGNRSFLPESYPDTTQWCENWVPRTIRLRGVVGRISDLPKGTRFEGKSSNLASAKSPMWNGLNFLR